MNMRDWSRRDVLAALVGLPAASAAVGGCSKARPPLPAGRIVGASSAFGHRLRDSAHITPQSNDWVDTRVVIVGGGVAGYSAARRLLAAGVRDFVLIEIESEPGGLSRSGKSQVASYPWAAHYLPVPMKENRALVDLLCEMNVVSEIDAFGEPIVAPSFLCQEPAERHFADGRWHADLVDRTGRTAAERTQFQAFARLIDDWVAWRDNTGRRAFAIPLNDCSDDPKVTKLDHITMQQWMDQHGLTSKTLRWYIDYCCRDDYGMRMGQTSAWAGLFYFASRVRRPGDVAQPLITWPEGNGRFISHMHELIEEEADVRLGLAVTEINCQPAVGDGLEVVAVERDSKAAVGFRTSHVVFAAPQYLRPFLIRPNDTSAPDVRRFEYGSWFVANMHLANPPVERDVPLAWDNVLHDSQSLGYIVATHQIAANRSASRTDGPTVLTYYYPLCEADPAHARARLLEMDWETCAEIVLNDLERAHPDIRQIVERIDVMRWGHAMVRACPGFIWSRHRRDASRPYRRIHFANSDLSGLPLFEEAFYHGNRAAEEVLSALKVSFESIL